MKSTLLLALFLIIRVTSFAQACDECSFPRFSNVPPPGAINSVDYLITSHVSTHGSNYVFTLFLETAESREVVNTVYIEFSANVESANNAGKQAAM